VGVSILIHPDTFVKPTHRGIGLFAARDFERGEILWIIDDHDVKIPVNEYSLLDTKQKQKLNIYSYMDFHYRVIIPWDEGKYVNHDCEPNSTGIIQYDNISIALKDIKSGEEIVEDYGCYFGHFESFSCQCGSSNCRKLISNEQSYREDLRIDLSEIRGLINSLEQPLLKIRTKENQEFLRILESA